MGVNEGGFLDEDLEKAVEENYPEGPPLIPLGDHLREVSKDRQELVSNEDLQRVLKAYSPEDIIDNLLKLEGQIGEILKDPVSKEELKKAVQGGLDRDPNANQKVILRTWLDRISPEDIFDTENP